MTDRRRKELGLCRSGSQFHCFVIHFGVRSLIDTSTLSIKNHLPLRPTNSQSFSGMGIRSDEELEAAIVPIHEIGDVERIADSTHASSRGSSSSYSRMGRQGGSKSEIFSSSIAGIGENAEVSSQSHDSLEELFTPPFPFLSRRTWEQQFTAEHFYTGVFLRSVSHV